jgi:hypothetical protein
MVRDYFKNEKRVPMKGMNVKLKGKWPTVILISRQDGTMEGRTWEKIDEDLCKDGEMTHMK